ncbi:MAG: T9SS type A sorting domain-containing protein, partial [Bacteroidota bacterium]
ENFGQPQVGKVTVSWNGESSENQAFSLLFKAKGTTNFAKALQLNSSITNAEAYLKDGDLQNVALAFKASIAAIPLAQLHQNTPNPFDESTTIAFDLQKAQEATLEIRDVNGKLIYRLEQEFEAGENQVSIERKALSTGVLYYTLEVEGHRMTKRMVVLE